jgi:hypothetical protein
MDPSILHGLDNHFQLLVCEPSHVLRYKSHAFLCIELPHLTRRQLVARATRTNFKADSFSLCVPRLGKSVTGCEKGLRVCDRAPSPLGRRQVNGHCLQGGICIHVLCFPTAYCELELELELIQTQMTQKPMLLAEGECVCVAQMACAKIRGRGRPSASKRERHLWVVSTLEMHTGRRLTCGTRSSIIAEVKTSFQRTGRLMLCLWANAPQRQELLPQPSE